MKRESLRLKRNMAIASLALIIALMAAASATFAWYIYNTKAHTTSVHLAAGSNVSIEISNAYDGTYGSSTVLESFVGLLSPVSTNRILNNNGSEAFQKVEQFVNGASGQPRQLAKDFSAAKSTDYYKTTVYVRSKGGETDLYISDITFEDGDEKNPISSAIRIGMVVHESGRDKAAEKELIFAISDAKNPQREYNTYTGREGYVLRYDTQDGSTVEFKPYTKDNYVNYNKDTGEVTMKEDSEKLCDLRADVPTQIDIYIWLEGCDEDCTTNLEDTTLKNIAVSFAGYFD